MEKKEIKSDEVLFKPLFKTAVVLSIIIAVLMAVATLGGLLIKDLYRDNLTVTSAWYGNDIITLFIAIPLLVLSLVFLKRGSPHAILVWLGMLFYTLYNYAFYLFGASFNSFFLIYVALFTLSIFALIFGIASLDDNNIKKHLRISPKLKWISGYMMLVSLLLGLFHVAISLSYIFTGQVPGIVINIEHPTNIISALDLSFVVSFGFLGAIWLWKGQTWGYVLAVMWNIKGAVYLLALSLASVQTFRLGAADDIFQLALWGPIGIGCIISSVLLLRNLGFNKSQV